MILMKRLPRRLIRQRLSAPASHQVATSFWRICGRSWAAAGMVFVSALAGISQEQATANTSPAWRAVFNQIERDWPQAPQMSTAELAHQLTLARERRPLLIDVRSPEEFAVSHLQHAVNAESPAEISALVRKLPPARAVVLYCSVGVRSSRATQQLFNTRRTNVFNLKGSIFLWANEDGPVVREGKPVTEVHPYNRRWGQLLNAKLHPKEQP